MIKIAVVTSNRADYGLLQPLIINLSEDHDVEFQLFVTGSHLDEKYGMTKNEILEDGLVITESIKIPTPKSDEVSTVYSISMALIKFEKSLEVHEPDWVILLGDRFEIFAFALAAFLTKKRIAHISGGEVTSGAMDDVFRHNITKMSELHFTSHDVYKNRVVQLGESPSKVFNFGSLSTENFSNYEDSDPFIDIDIPSEFKIGLCTVHPVTSGEDSELILDSIFEELSKSNDMYIIFTASNMDDGGDLLNEKIQSYCKVNKSKSVYYQSLGKNKFFSALKRIDFMIGNSSSGLTEAPLFSLPSINIGTRQNGRIMPPSVIQCPFPNGSIKESIAAALKIKSLDSHRYGDGKASSHIIREIKRANTSLPQTKVFHDVASYS